MHRKNKTIIMVADRLSSVMNADEIVVLQMGKAIEQGNHKELYRSKGHYNDFWL